VGSTPDLVVSPRKWRTLAKPCLDGQANRKT